MGFLAAIFVVAEVARLAGLFAAAGQLIEHRRRTAPDLIVAVALLAAAITIALSLDATAVLFTPVVIGMVREQRVVRESALLTTVEMANVASLALPVSNLTSLLVFPATGLSFAAFGLRMAIPTVAVVAAVTWAGTRAVDPDTSGDDSQVAATLPHLDRFGVAVTIGLGLMLIGFLTSSLAGIEPVWIAAATAVVLGVATIALRRCTLKAAVVAASPRFLVFVGALAIVVGAAQRAGLDSTVRSIMPGGDGLAALLGVALIAAVLANLVNNLPATLVLLTVIPSGAVPRLLALLIGVNVGPNLTYTGSLATLLWRREVRRARVEPPSRAFYRMALLTTPLALVTATIALWLSLRVLG